MAKVIDLEGRLSRITADDINSNISDDSYKFYENKIEVAKNVIKALCSSDNRSNHVILAASMQAGKTAVMNGICNLLMLSGISNDLMIKKFIFATGMNDVKLKEQTIDRAFSQIIGANSKTVCTKLDEKDKYSKFFFLKNSDLANVELSLKNSILFLDEVQFGTNEGNILSRFLYKNGVDWKNKDEFLKANNTFIVSVSATPFSEMVSDTINVKKIINISKDDNYIGVSEFLANDMIYEATRNDLMDGSIFDYIREAYDRMYNETKGCGIIFIRTRDFSVIKYNQFVLDKFDVIELACHKSSNIDYDSLNEPIDKMIRRYNYLYENNKKGKVRPILVLVKGAFRAGVTIPSIHKDFTYMVYDYSVNPETTAQALLGRMCGYRDISKDNWKRTKFYLNKSLSEQYGKWEQDYSDKSNIPSERTKFEWVDKGYSGGKVEFASKCTNNVAIQLTDDEILTLYSISGKRTSANLCKKAEPLYQEILRNRNLDEDNIMKYNYIGEVYLRGRNNYACSTQRIRFDDFQDNNVVFQFRPDKVKDFQIEHDGRTEFNEDDLGLRSIYLVLDANIIPNDEDEYGKPIISGNKRLLVYQVEVALRTRVPNRSNMFKMHKCTDLKYENNFIKNN